MRAEYKRDFHHSYLILSEDGEVDCDAYPVRMVLGSRIPGLLACEINHVDERTLFYYDITSQQTLASASESKKLGKKELTMLAEALLNAMEEMEAYLLSPSALLLQPEYIYLNRAEERIGFCYWPGKEKPQKAGMAELMEYLLPRIDHCDQEAVVIGYRLYRQAMDGELAGDEIRRELYRREEVQMESPLLKEEQPEQEMQQHYRLVEELAENPKKSPKRFHLGRVLAAVFLTVFFGGCLYLLGVTNISRQTLLLFGGALLLCGSVILLLRRLESRKKKCVDAAAEAETASGSQLSFPELKEELSDPESATKEESGVRILVRETVSEESATELLTAKKPPTGFCLKPLGEAGGATVFLKQGIQLLGTLEGAVDICLPSTAVSRLHARIICKEEILLYDMNSKNGTYVNGKLLSGETGCTLHAGDQITFADLSYRLQFQNE